MTQQNDIWVFSEVRNNQVLDVSLELLSKAASLKEPQAVLRAIICSPPGFNLTPSIFAAGAGAVTLVEQEERRLGTDLAPVIAQLVKERRPSLFLFGATSMGRDLAPAVAAYCDTGCAADLCDLARDDAGNFLQIAPAFGGRMMATVITPLMRPVIATVRPGVFEQRNSHPAGGDVETVRLNHYRARARILKETTPPPCEIGLSSAKVVVAGGAGVRDDTGWEMIKLLARRLNGAVGATRSAVDEGRVPQEAMIGSSGRSIRPDLYIAIGISGDIHHMTGVREAGLIVAVNIDASAPIFSQADYGIVGDYHTILPAWLQALQTEQC